MTTSLALEGAIKQYLLELEETQGRVGVLCDLYDSLQASPTEYTLERVHVMESFGVSVALETYYSAKPKQLKHQVAMEGVMTRIKEMILHGVNVVLDLLKKIIAWFRGEKSATMTKDTAETFEKAAEKTVKEGMSSVIAKAHIRRLGERLAKQGLSIQFAGKLRLPHWDILNAGKYNTECSVLLRYVSKNNISTSVGQIVTEAKNWFGKEAEGQKSPTATLPDTLRATIQAKSEEYVTQSINTAMYLSRCNQGIERELLMLKQPTSVELEYNVAVLMEIIQKRIQSMNFPDAAKASQGAMQALQNIEKDCQAFQKTLIKDMNDSKEHPGLVFVHRTHLSCLSEMMVTIKTVAKSYQYVDTHFKQCTELFLICQEYYIAVNHALLREDVLDLGDKEELKTSIRAIEESRRQLQKLLD